MMMFLGITSTAISGASFWRRHTISERNRNGALRVSLAHDVFVQLSHDLTRRHLVQPDFIVNFSRQINDHCF